MDRSAPTHPQCLLREIRARLKGSSSFAFLPIGSRLLREQRSNHHPTPEDLAHGLGQNACKPPSPFTSFDHLVGAGEERRWHSNAKRLGGFHIDDQLETSWLLDRQIGGLGAFEDFVDVDGSLAKKV